MENIDKLIDDLDKLRTDMILNALTRDNVSLSTLPVTMVFFTVIGSKIEVHDFTGFSLNFYNNGTIELIINNMFSPYEIYATVESAKKAAIQFNENARIARGLANNFKEWRNL